MATAVTDPRWPWWQTETAASIVLLIDNAEDSARLPLVLKKQG